LFKDKIILFYMDNTNPMATFSDFPWRVFFPNGVFTGLVKLLAWSCWLSVEHSDQVVITIPSPSEGWFCLSWDATGSYSQQELAMTGNPRFYGHKCRDIPLSSPIPFTVKLG